MPTEGLLRTIPKLSRQELLPPAAATVELTPPALDGLAHEAIEVGSDAEASELCGEPFEVAKLPKIELVFGPNPGSRPTFNELAN